MHLAASCSPCSSLRIVCGIRRGDRRSLVGVSCIIQCARPSPSPSSVLRAAGTSTPRIAETCKLTARSPFSPQRLPQKSFSYGVPSADLQTGRSRTPPSSGTATRRPTARPRPWPRDAPGRTEPARARAAARPAGGRRTRRAGPAARPARARRPW